MQLWLEGLESWIMQVVLVVVGKGEKGLALRMRMHMHELTPPRPPATTNAGNVNTAVYAPHLYHHQRHHSRKDTRLYCCS